MTPKPLYISGRHVASGITRNSPITLGFDARVCDVKNAEGAPDSSPQLLHRHVCEGENCDCQGGSSAWRIHDAFPELNGAAGWGDLEPDDPYTGRTGNQKDKFSLEARSDILAMLRKFH